jgi:hypothetical protein
MNSETFSKSSLRSVNTNIPPQDVSAKRKDKQQLDITHPTITLLGIRSLKLSIAVIFSIFLVVFMVMQFLDFAWTSKGLVIRNHEQL